MTDLMLLLPLLFFPRQLRLLTALFTFCPTLYRPCSGFACPLLPPELDHELLETRTYTLTKSAASATPSTVWRQEGSPSVLAGPWILVSALTRGKEQVTVAFSHL